MNAMRSQAMGTQQKHTPDSRVFIPEQDRVPLYVFFIKSGKL